MSVLNSLFNVARGWPNENAIDETAPQNAGISANTPLVEGDIVSLDSAGTWSRADSVDLAGAGSVAALGNLLASLKQMWLVVSGAEPDQYDGLKQGYVGADFTYVPYKVTAIRGHLMFETARFVGGRAYVPGDAIAVDGGLLDRTLNYGAGYNQYAEVLAYDSALGKLTVTTS
jgi:hypothetical protein